MINKHLLLFSPVGSLCVYVCVCVSYHYPLALQGDGNRESYVCVYVCLFLVSLSPSIAGRLEPRFESVCLEAVGFF